MIVAYLSDIKQAVKISELCEKYQSSVAVDACYGRYIVDAASILGLQSMIGDKITLKLIGSDQSKVESLSKQLLEIDGVKTEC